jgi:lysophospholipase L1-like esterase
MPRMLLGLSFVAAASISFTGGPRASEPPDEAPARGWLKAVHVEEEPTIDGTLGSPLWEKCPPLELGDVTSERPGPFKTTARVLFGPTRLHVAVDCADPGTGSLRQTVAERDGPVWEDDCVEIFVTGDRREGYFHFTVNPRGTLMDARFARSERESRDWNSSAAARASVAPSKGWSATLAIPLAEIGAYVGEDQAWELNITRTRPARGGSGASLWSWAILGSQDFHDVFDYGRVEDVRVPRRPDGVTRAAEPLPPPRRYEEGKPAGGVTVYRRIQQLSIAEGAGGIQHTLEISLRDSTGLKVAFLARGTGGVTEARLNLYDERSGDNTTSDAYRPIDGKWRPVLYRADRFYYNDGMNRLVARAASYRSLLFHGERTPEGKGRLELRGFALYRGEDSAPPGPPGGLTARPEEGGVRLSWKEASDNVGAATYAVARGPAGGKIAKVGETHDLAFTDKPPAPGAYEYRVLAADFQDNLGPWSEAIRVEVKDGSGERAQSPEEKDRIACAESVRKIFAAGRGRVVQGRVLCLGDSLTGATNYRRYVESALGTCDAWARGYESQRTDFGRRKIAEDLAEVKPELCLILLGTNNPKDPASLPRATEDLLEMARSCEERGVVAIIGTIPPRGFGDPLSAPEAGYNEALMQTCRARNIPIAHIFEEFQSAGDRRKLLADDGVHLVTGGWEATARGWKAAVDQVRFALLDRPD